MHTLKFKAVIGDNHVLTLTLPPTVPPGTASVTVVMDDPRPAPAEAASGDPLDALLRFGDGRRLGGLSFREMAAEGRR